jgi:hypothetical protein
MSEGRLSRYDELRPQMRHGDVIAFGGKSRLSEIIKWRTRSQFSHVALVLRWALNGGFGDTLMICEATTLTDLPDAWSNEVIQGVQLHRLSERLASYRGSAWWCGLRAPLIESLHESADKWLRTTHERRVRYDSLQAIGAGIDWWDRLGFRNEADFDTLFCSELVGRYHQLAGLWSPDENMSEKTPEDIAHAHYLHLPQLIVGG